MESEENLEDPGLHEIFTASEFIIYSSPRYYRLIFPSLKPTTKNGDLVSALNEMQRSKILTYDSDWDRIKLTKKGNIYKKLIKRMLDMEALHVPQSNGLFDYRSEAGRKAIIELIRFLSAKLNFNEYFQYLDLPIFEEERKDQWQEIFGTESTDDIDFTSEEGRLRLEEFLNKIPRKHWRQKNSIQKSLFQHTEPIKLNVTLIKKFLQTTGLNRPVPLFNHFNAGEPEIFSTHDKFFYVNLGELNKVKKALEEYLSDFQKDENRWLGEYFNLLKLPTSLFGFQLSDKISYASETNAFLNLAIEGPRILANQFSIIEGLGDLSLILFPVNKHECIVIFCGELDLLYYFTISQKDCQIGVETDLIPFSDFPEVYRTSRKRFGKLLSQSRTLEYYSITKIENLLDKESKKLIEEQQKQKKIEMEAQVKLLSQYSASFFTVCQIIAEKFTPSFRLNKVVSIYENGALSFHDLDSDTILTSIQKGAIQFSNELKKILKKIEDSMQEILDLQSNVD